MAACTHSAKAVELATEAQRPNFLVTSATVGASGEQRVDRGLDKAAEAKLADFCKTAVTVGTNAIKFLQLTGETK